MRYLKLKLGKDGVLEVTAPDPFGSGAIYTATQDLERLITVVVEAVKAAGGTVTQEIRTEVSL